MSGRAEVRRRTKERGLRATSSLQVQARDLDHNVAQHAFDDEAALDARVRKSIKEHGA